MQKVQFLNNTLFHADCFDAMPMIDGKVDLICTDLPYGSTQCEWDSIIPFNRFIRDGKKVLYFADYLNLQLKKFDTVSYKAVQSEFESLAQDGLWQYYKRLIKPNGAIVLFGSEPFSTQLRQSNLEWFKYDWIWNKTKVGNIFNCKNAPQKNYENIMVFSEGTIANKSQNLMPYNPIGLQKIPKIKRSNTHKEGSGKDRTIRERPCRTDEYFQEFSNYPKQVLYFDSIHGIHPTQKPVSLLEYLIKTYSNEGETVLDNTMGSGSCCVACINTKRAFIGIEQNETYFETACKRISEATKQQTIF